MGLVFHFLAQIGVFSLKLGLLIHCSACEFQHHIEVVQFKAFCQLRNSVVIPLHFYAVFSS